MTDKKADEKSVYIAELTNAEADWDSPERIKKTVFADFGTLCSALKVALANSKDITAHIEVVAFVPSEVLTR